ncbi:MAG: membrane integrity-associated transporter subunit PqiC [Betaproteobacteria bacterium]|nr:membrane integrity-associated transporter subunit PqiC [Betaproteobacteria bacterium]
MRNPATTRALALAAAFALLGGCAGLQPPPVEHTNIYLLDARPVAGPERPNRDLVLAVDVPRAQPGFDTARIAYVREPHRLDYYARNRWADTPARMLAPLIAQALEQSRGFRAVVRMPNVVPADLRLDTDLVRLQHDFGTKPSRVQLTLRARLIDVPRQRVLATRVFDEIESAPTEDAYGGVIAANGALQRLLARLADFCVEASAR